MIAELWPHQQYSIEQTTAAIAAGEQRILLTAPTGAGKTRTAAELTKWGVEHSRKVLLLTNRKMVREQTSSVLDSWGITHGIRAAGTIPELEKDVQVSSIQTELSRVYKTVEWDLHDAGLVIIDEPHAQKGEAMARLMNDYEARGAAMIGTTATPIELAEYFTHLIVAATNKDCRNCGAHVPCETFAPDEPDLTKLGNKKIGEDLSAAEQRKVIRASVIFGRVLDHWRKLNPAELPTILFAPGVEESLFFAQQLSANGVRSAHVDGNRIWWEGEFQSSNQETREELREGSKNGRFQVICNRYCLDDQTEILTREGWAGINDISEDHHVANWDDGAIYFEKPRDVIIRPRGDNEAMVFLETPRRSIRVTENHRMLYRTTAAGSFLKSEAGELTGRVIAVPVSGQSAAEDATIEQPDMLRDMRRRITANAFAMRHRGYDVETSRAEAERRIRERSGLCYRQPSELSEDECEFIGIWLGDGNRQPLAKGGVEYRMWQGMNQPTIVAHIDCLISRLGFDVVRYTKHMESGRDVRQWSFSRGTGFGSQRRRGLFAIEPYLKKNGTDLFWSLNERQFTALIRGLWIADGFPHGDSISFGAKILICGARRKIFDLLQAIGVCRGYRASLRKYKNGPTHTMFILSLKKTAEHRMTKYRLQRETEHKPETVWCVTTSSGNIITRRRGSVTMMGNCLREGVDFPWLGHCIMACIFGSLQSYLQAGGRLLRSYPGLESVTLQDHGGNYWRHGSLNADREWSLELTDHIAVGLRLEGLRNKSTPEPMTCPKCFAVRLSGNSCYRCGYIAAGKSRRVIEIDGTLREVTGDILKPRRIKETPNQERTWEQEYYHRARKSKNHMTFNQAYALHFREKYFYPPKDLPLMPREPADWFLPVCDVPRDRLIQPSRGAG